MLEVNDDGINQEKPRDHLEPLSGIWKWKKKFRLSFSKDYDNTNEGWTRNIPDALKYSLSTRKVFF
jgi:hypothetical protein